MLAIISPLLLFSQFLLFAVSGVYAVRLDLLGRQILPAWRTKPTVSRWQSVSRRLGEDECVPVLQPHLQKVNQLAAFTLSYKQFVLQ
jgi:hypothetical protein